MTISVLLVAPLPPPYGGISHWTSMILRYSRRRSDLRIDIVDTAPRYRAVTDKSIWKRIFLGGASLPLDVACVAWQLLRGRHQTIHITTSGQLGLLRDICILMLAKAFRVPTILHIRFGRAPDLVQAGGAEGVLFRRVVGLADHVLVLDRGSERALNGWCPSVSRKTELVPNPVDLDRVPYNQHKQKVAIFLGWVIPSKGIEELLEAWSSIESEGWQLEVVGPVDLNYRRILEHKFNLGNVEFLGELAHPVAMERLASASVFVFPSHTEGFPNAVVEAMAAGAAIIASAVGAIPEILADGAGILVPPKDSERLRVALAALLKQPQNISVIGERARARAVQNFSLEAVFETYRRLWDRQAACRGQ